MACLFIYASPPKAAHNGVDGIDRLADGQCVLKIRLRAAPHEGEANAALCRFIADLSHQPARMIKLTKGSKSRIKSVHISGNPSEILERLIAALPSSTKG